SDVPVTWHIRGEGRPGTALLDALPALHLSPETDYVWLCAEALTVKQIRRHLVGTVGIDRSRILFSGYWRPGEARTCLRGLFADQVTDRERRSRLPPPQPTAPPAAGA